MTNISQQDYEAFLESVVSRDVSPYEAVRSLLNGSGPSPMDSLPGAEAN
jgi:hypothetical protein